MASLDKLASMDGWDVGEDVTGMPCLSMMTRGRTGHAYFLAGVSCLLCILLDPVRVVRIFALRVFRQTRDSTTKGAASAEKRKLAYLLLAASAQPHNLYPFPIIVSVCLCYAATRKMGRLARPLHR